MSDITMTSFEDDMKTISDSVLNQMPYRKLQQLSKILKLPGNTKRDVMVKLIKARKDGKHTEINEFFALRKELQKTKEMEKAEREKKYQNLNNKLNTQSAHLQLPQSHTIPQKYLKGSNNNIMNNIRKAFECRLKRNTHMSPHYTSTNDEMFYKHQQSQQMIQPPLAMLYQYPPPQYQYQSQQASENIPFYQHYYPASNISGKSGPGFNPDLRMGLQGTSAFQPFRSPQYLAEKSNDSDQEIDVGDNYGYKEFYKNSNEISTSDVASEAAMLQDTGHQEIPPFQHCTNYWGDDLSKQCNEANQAAYEDQYRNREYHNDTETVYSNSGYENLCEENEMFQDELSAWTGVGNLPSFNSTFRRPKTMLWGYQFMIKEDFYKYQVEENLYHKDVDQFFGDQQSLTQQSSMQSRDINPSYVHMNRVTSTLYKQEMVMQRHVTQEAIIQQANVNISQHLKAPVYYGNNRNDTQPQPMISPAVSTLSNPDSGIESPVFSIQDKETDCKDDWPANKINFDSHTYIPVLTMGEKNIEELRTKACEFIEKFTAIYEGNQAAFSEPKPAVSEPNPDVTGEPNPTISNVTFNITPTQEYDHSSDSDMPSSSTSSSNNQSSDLSSIPDLVIDLPEQVN